MGSSHRETQPGTSSSALIQQNHVLRISGLPGLSQNLGRRLRWKHRHTSSSSLQSITKAPPRSLRAGPPVDGSPQAFPHLLEWCSSILDTANARCLGKRNESCSSKSNQKPKQNNRDRTSVESECIQLVCPMSSLPPQIERSTTLNKTGQTLGKLRN